MSYSKSGQRAKSTLRADCQQPREDVRKYPFISPIWLADKARKEQQTVFDNTVKKFLEREDEQVEVEYEPVTEGVVCLQAAVVRLGLEAQVEVLLDDYGRIIVKKTT